MAGFMDLSMEIRIMVYEYCLVKDYPFVPYNKEYYHVSDRLTAFRKDPPAMALLRVSRTIVAETLPVLYGRNVWRITVYAPLMDIPIPDGPRWNSLWDLQGELIKHVILVFDQRDIDVDDYVLTTRVNYTSRADWASAHPQSSCHDEARDNMCCSWDLKFQHVEKLLNLRSIELDVGGLFCYFGCCRQDILEVLLEKLEERFTAEPGLPTLLKPKLTITIRGLRGENERRIMRNTDLPFRILEEESWDLEEYTAYE